METLKINPIGSLYSNILYKEIIIKEINKFRLKNKNKWYQVEVRLNNYQYRMKCYGTWVQLNYIYEDDGQNFIICNDGSAMDISTENFKKYLFDVIK